MNLGRIVREILAAIPVTAAVIGAAYVVARHRTSPFDASTLLAWLIALVALLGVSELAQRYGLLFALDRKVDSLTRFSDRLLTGHVADIFLRDRNDFPPFAGRVKNARAVWVLGISLQGLVGYHKGVFVQKIRDRATLRFLMMDPESPSSDAKACGLFNATDPAVLKRDIRRTIETISEFRKPDGADVSLRLTNYVPGYGLVLIDPDRDDGVIIVELYPYLVTSSERVHFELTTADSRWYTYFRDQFNSIWNDAREV